MSKRLGGIIAENIHNNNIIIGCQPEKKYFVLHTVANPARGLLNREKKKKKSLAAPPPPPRAARSEKKKKKNTRRIHSLGAMQVGVTQAGGLGPSLYGEYVIRSFLPNGVFLPCDHVLDFLHQLIIM